MNQVLFRRVHVPVTVVLNGQAVGEDRLVLQGRLFIPADQILVHTFIGCPWPLPIFFRVRVVLHKVNLIKAKSGITGGAMVIGATHAVGGNGVVSLGFQQRDNAGSVLHVQNIEGGSSHHSLGISGKQFCLRNVGPAAGLGHSAAQNGAAEIGDAFQIIPVCFNVCYDGRLEEGLVQNQNDVRWFGFTGRNVRHGNLG